MRIDNLPSSIERNQEYTEDMRLFTVKLGNAMSGRGSQRTPRRNKIEGLNAILNEGVEKLNSEQLTGLYKAYQAINMPEKMVELYNLAKTADKSNFVYAPMVLEDLSTALIRKGDALSSEDARADYEAAKEVSASLIAYGHRSGVAYKNLSKIYQREGNTEEATKIAEKGFAATFETSIGMRAIHGNLVMGKDDKAKETANVVYLAALRDGAEESHDSFLVMNALEAACIAGKSSEVIQELSAKLLENVKTSFRAGNIVEDLTTLQKYAPLPEIEALKEKLSKVKDSEIESESEELARKTKEQAKKDAEFKKEKERREKEGHPDYNDENAPGKASVSNKEKLKSVINYSYNYRGCGSEFRGESRISGNMIHGGQLPDHSVSRQDLDLFSGLIEKSPKELGMTLEDIKKKLAKHKVSEPLDMEKPLSEIKDPELFMAISDTFVRKGFSTENFAETGLHMENNAGSKSWTSEKGEKESIYDRTVRSAIVAAGKEIGGKDSNIDSKTNISAIFAMGMGDCRHHAQVKQILFDVWQKKEMNQQLSAMYGRVLSGKPEVQANAENEQAFYNVLDTQLRTSDVKVLLPIQMNTWEDKYGTTCDDTYNPKKTEDNKYIEDTAGKLHNLEDHTLSWLVKKDRSGNLTGFGVRDSFYHTEHYDWACQDVDLDKLTVNKKGEPNFPAGTIPADKTNTGKPLEVRQMPLPYNTGKRDTTVKMTMGYSVSFIGIPLQGLENSESFLRVVRNRKMVAGMMKNLRHKVTNLSDDPNAPVQEPKKKKVPLQAGIGKFVKNPDTKFDINALKSMKMQRD